MAARFQPTRWTLVRRAAERSGTPESREALAELCREYWYPAYAFIRRLGFEADAARDVTQSFFVRLLDTPMLAAADPERGRFRAFLMASLRHFAANERDRDQAQKRMPPGGLLSLDFDDGERRYLVEPPDPQTPEHLFERRWAEAVLDRAVRRLQAECEGDERKRALAARVAAQARNEDAEGTLRDLAASLGVPEGTLRMANHRLHQRFHAILSDEVAQTVDSAEDVAAELLHLRAVLAGE